jgi:signal peptidase II
MQKGNPPRGRRRAVLFGSVALLVILVDQLSKLLIRANLDLGEVLFDAGFFRLIRIHNTGAAFGIFKDYTLVLSLIALAGIAVILALLYFMHSRWSFLESKLAWVAMALVVGGTISNNLIDRLWLGYVTDFADFKVWPAFNVADASAVVGTIILVYCIIRLALTGKHQE